VLQRGQECLVSLATGQPTRSRSATRPRKPSKPSSATSTPTSCCFADEHLVDVMRKARDVRRKAREISLERVYNHCMRQVCKNMSVHNVLAWLVKADEYGVEGTRTAALCFLASNLAQVQVRIPKTELFREIVRRKDEGTDFGELLSGLREAGAQSCCQTSRI
jgi:hypothetical protein